MASHRNGAHAHIVMTLQTTRIFTYPTAGIKRRCAFLILTVGLSLPAFAQTSTDAEVLRRRMQQEAEERLRQQQAPDIRLPRPTPAVDPEATDLPAETPCFPIASLKLEGERLDAFPHLPTMLEPYAGRCIGREGINLIVKRLSARLVADGYITTRLGLPEQELASGTLRLVLVPGIVRAIRVADDTAAGDWRTAFPIRPGDLLNLRDLEQGLEQMKRLPSQDVDFSIAPGEAPGESDIVIAVKRIKPFRLGLTLDDAGVRATGKRQASASLAIDNPLGLNDLFTLTLNNDAENDPKHRGTRGYGFQYAIPWGYWNFTLAENRSHYHQTIQGTNQTFATSGDSINREVKILRLVHRNQTSKTSLQFRALHRAQRSFIEDAEILVQRRNTAAAELGVVHRHYLGTAQLDLTYAQRVGVPWFGGQRDAANHNPASATFDYRLQTLDLGLIAPFKLANHSLRWISAFRGQHSKDVLYTADQFAIGNRYTVRGFDGERTLAAERGWYFRNELEMPLADSGQSIYAGLDHGRVSGPSAQTLAGRSLTGAVAGARGSVFGLNYDLFAAWALKKPEGFETKRPVAGFQLSTQF